MEKINKTARKNLKISSLIILLLSIIQASENSQSDFNKFKLNATYTDAEYIKLRDFDLTNNVKEMIKCFENRLSIEQNLDEDRIRQRMKRKQFIFNKNFSWQVEEKELNENESNQIHTQLIFYFSNESMTLNLCESDLVKFMNDEYIDYPYIITELLVDPNLTDFLRLETIPIKNKMNIYKDERKYFKNIKKIFGILKGLFVSSIRSDKVIENNNLKIIDTNNLESRRKGEFLGEVRGDENELNVDTDFLIRAGQYHMLVCYEKYFSNYIKQRKIILSIGLLRLLKWYKAGVGHGVTEIIRTNYLELDIPEKDLNSNLEEYGNIYKTVQEILRLIQKYLKLSDKKNAETVNNEKYMHANVRETNPKNLLNSIIKKIRIKNINTRIQKSLRKLEKKLIERKLNPIVMQKLLFYFGSQIKDYQRFRFLGHTIPDMIEISRKIRNYWDDVRQFKDFKVSLATDFHKDFNVLTEKIDEYNRLNTSAGMDELRVLFDKDLTEEFLVVRFYNYIEGIVNTFKCTRESELISSCRDSLDFFLKIFPPVDKILEKLNIDHFDVLMSEYKRFKSEIRTINFYYLDSNLLIDEKFKYWFTLEDYEDKYMVYYYPKYGEYYTFIPNGKNQNKRRFYKKKEKRFIMEV